jgi:hypothetical protein
VWGVSENLKNLLQKVLSEDFDGHQGRMAKAAGMTVSPLGRAVQTGTNFGVAPCLRLAVAVGRPASEFLLAAGKGRLLDLIQRAFGDEKRNAPRPEIRRALAALNALPPDLLAATVSLLEATAKNAAVEHPPQTPRHRNATR